MSKKEGESIQRLDWLDISKGIAIILVIVGHVSLLKWDPYRKIIFSIHMPLFFIVAGYTSKSKLNADIFIKLLKRLFFPYCITFLICMVITGVQTCRFDLPLEIERFFWASGVPADYGPGKPVTGESVIPVTGALWFLPCMFFCKVIWTVLLKYVERYKETVRCILVLALVVLGYVIGQRYKIPMGLDIAVFCIGFMYAGYLLRKYNMMEKKIVSIGFLALILWSMALKSNAIELSARFYREFPLCIWSFCGAIAGSYVVFIVADELLNKLPFVREFFIFCGKNSLLILCIHVIEDKVINWQTLISIVGRPFVTAICIASVRTIFVIFICFFVIRIKKKLTNVVATN